MSQDPAHPTPKRLYRSRRDRMLGGVCAGLADYFGLDVTLVRIGAVATILLPGPSVVLYLIAWVIVPEEPTLPPAGPPWTPGP